MIRVTWALVRRRWVTALIAAALLGAGCAWLSTQLQPTYRATGQMVFLLPPEQPDPKNPPLNPYLNQPEGMGTTANLIAGMVSTNDVARDLAERGLDAEYAVGLVPGAGPVLAFHVTADSPGIALATRSALMTLVEENLALLQERAKTPANQLMTASRPSVSRTAEPQYAAVYKAMGGAIAGSVLAVLMMCLLVDRLARIRTRRVAARAIRHGHEHAADRHHHDEAPESTTPGLKDPDQGGAEREVVVQSDDTAGDTDGVEAQREEPGPPGESVEDPEDVGEIAPVSKSERAKLQRLAG